MAAGATLALTGPTSFPHSGADRGTCPVWISATIPTTAIDHEDDNILLSAQLPAVAYIKNAAGVFIARWTDMDSHATETLDFDLGFGGADGVLDFTMINNGTASEDAGVGASAQIAAQDPWIDIGGLYVVMEVIAVAATPVAGTVQVAFEYTQNVNAALAFA
jgi:hypothetical protein